MCSGHVSSALNLAITLNHHSECLVFTFLSKESFEPPLKHVREPQPAAESQGNPPLHYAAGSGSSGCVEALLKAGANANAKDAFGEKLGLEGKCRP